MRLMIILGSVRQNRRGEKVAAWVKRVAEADKRFEIELADVKKLGLPFYDEPIGGPFMIAASGSDYTNPKGKAWAQAVSQAEAYILVTAEYNHSYPASLKNALDWVGPEWGGKPVTFVSYGGLAGGARAVEHLRQVVAELGLIQTKAAVHITGIGDAFGKNGEPKNQNLTPELNKALNSVFELGNGKKS